MSVTIQPASIPAGMTTNLVNNGGILTASVQIVGIYLVFASLIIPALATVGIKRGNRLLAGYLIGAVSFFIGIVVSYLLDLPTGAVIVWTMAAVALLTGLAISDKRAA